MMKCYPAWGRSISRVFAESIYFFCLIPPPPSYETSETGHSQRQGIERDKCVVLSDMAN